jgi:hypothetical protein
MEKETITADALRQLLLEQPEAFATRVLALLISIAIFVCVVHLVRTRRLREEYSPIWLGAALAITVLSLWLGALRWLTSMIGAWTPSSTLFFFGEIFLLALCLHYAVRLSQLANQLKILAQELALLRVEIAGRGAGGAQATRRSPGSSQP